MDWRFSRKTFWYFSSVFYNLNYFIDSKIIGALCLDGLARGDSLNFHVSKVLTENSAIFKIYENLKNFASDKHPINVVVKKINLSNDRLAWEHEIYNVR